MPIADDVLHVFKLIHNPFGLGVFISQFSNVSSPLADNAILVESFLREGHMVRAELGQFAESQIQRVAILWEINIPNGAFKSFS